MKYCQNCGGEVHEEAVVCIHCGRAIANMPAKTSNNNNTDTLITIALVFMIIVCVAYPSLGLLCGLVMLLAAIASGTASMLIAAVAILVICCIPLAWMLPLTITVSKRKKAHEPIGMGIKICTLIFVSMISGILLLCCNDE